ncbi:MAG: hypothetical protein HGA87_02240 [Desulfobulbaceae bacterium]|nr:hypothetical protein [Desulfobulbaceae bacterium]
MKKYSKYKDSGIDWIGPIPTHWETIRTRFVLKTISGNGFPEDLQGKKEGEYPFYKCSDINTAATFVDEANNYVDFDDVAKNKWDIIAKNSILLAKIGEALKKNHRKISRRDCLIDNNMMALSIRGQSISQKYLYYLMMLIRMEWFVNPGAVPSVDVGKFRSFRIPDLPKSEQVQIEAFLDDKTAKIDGLIAKKERMIELLKEERAAVINQAVTKGLDPNVEMKDSGAEWLGDVPKHWDVVSLRYIFDVKAGGDLKEEFFSDEKSEKHPYPIYTNSIKSDEAYGFSSKAFFKANTITVTGRGEIGHATYRDHEYDAIIRLLVLTPKQNTPCKYYAYFINSMLSFFGGSTAVSQLSSEQIKPYKVFSPSQTEQELITQYLDHETTKIDALVSREERSIELLKEYRTALISEAVTGEIDVRTA